VDYSEFFAHFAAFEESQKNIRACLIKSVWWRCRSVWHHYVRKLGKLCNLLFYCRSVNRVWLWVIYFVFWVYLVWNERKWFRIKQPQNIVMYSISMRTSLKALSRLHQAVKCVTCVQDETETYLRPHSACLTGFFCFFSPAMQVAGSELNYPTVVSFPILFGHSTT
jgi:hypothetical protein